MAVRLAPSARQQFLDTAGNPYVGAKLFTYLAGTSTKQATYTTSIGDVANTNPLVLDAAGRTPNGLWLTEGANYKFVLAPAFDTDPPTSAIYTEDGISGVNDTADSLALKVNTLDLAASSGSSLVGFLQSGTGAVATTVQKILRETVSVGSYGAPGDGTDQTAGFSAAAQAATAGNAQLLQRPDIPHGDWAVVHIPAGAYTLGSMVDTGNREIVWMADVAAVITNPQNLNGRLWRAGSKVNDFHHGTEDAAVSFSIMANRNNDEISPVSGFTNPNQLSGGNGRDTVGAYIGNRLPAATYGDAIVSSYTALGVTLSTAMTSDQQKKMRKGMIVQTRHATPYAAFVDSWTASTITVKDGWFLVDGSATGVAATPAGTDGLDVNIFRAAWALNANVFADANSYGTKINAFELGLRNEKGTPISEGGTLEANGMYTVNLKGTPDYSADNAYVAAGKWSYGYSVWGGVKNAFWYDGTVLPTATIQNLIYGKNAAGIPFFQVTAGGNIEVGLRGSGTATPAILDLHSGASDADYDARIISTGGTGSAAGGTMQLMAASILVGTTGTAVTLQGASVSSSAVLRPSADATYNLGEAALRWSTVYAATGAINTSDARQKQQIRELSAAEKAVAIRIKGLIRAFKFSDAVSIKGAGARIHVGVIAQDVEAAFAAEGLNGFDYGVLCYDEWEELPEVVESWGDEYDENGELIRKAGSVMVQQFRPAGSRYGVRYEEMLAFILSAL